MMIAHYFGVFKHAVTLTGSKVNQKETIVSDKTTIELTISYSKQWTASINAWLKINTLQH